MDWLLWYLVVGFIIALLGLAHTRGTPEEFGAGEVLTTVLLWPFIIGLAVWEAIRGE